MFCRGRLPGQSSRAARWRDSSSRRVSEAPVRSSAPGNRSGSSASFSSTVMRGPNLEATFAQVFSKTAAASPSTRTTATRSGSRRAIARNASRTRSWSEISSASKRPEAEAPAPDCALRALARASPSRGSSRRAESDPASRPRARARRPRRSSGGSRPRPGDLIGLGRVGEAVAQEKVAGGQCRADHDADVLAPGRFDQEPLGDRIEPGVRGVEQNARGSSRRWACLRAPASSSRTAPRGGGGRPAWRAASTFRSPRRPRK